MDEERHKLARDFPKDDRSYTDLDSGDNMKNPDRHEKEDKEKSCCKKFTFMETQLLVLLILAAIIIILLAVLIVLIRVSSFRYCTTPACAHQAGVMLAAMNTTADPCNDFYNYACGHWDQVHPAEPGIGKYSNFYRAAVRIEKLLYQLLEDGVAEVAGKNSTSVAKAITFYKACSDMNQRNMLGAAPLLNLITKLGGWTLTTKPALKASWSFLTTLAELNKLGIDAPFGVTVENNPLNSSQHVLSLSVGSYFFSRTEMMSSDPKFKKAFLAFGRAVVFLLGNGSISAELTAKLEKIWAFEKDMAKHQMTKLESRDPKKTNNIMTVSDVQKYLIGTSFDFLKLLKLSFGHEVKGTEKILVSDIKLVKYIAKKIKTMDQKVLANYMMMRVIAEMSNKLSYSFTAAMLQRKKAVTGSDIMSPTWKICILLTKNYFPLQLSALYVDKFFHKEGKTKVTHMVHQIKEALKKLISSSKWMDKPTKQVALKKLEYLQPSVAYPNDLFDLKKLDKSYHNISLNKSTFFKDYLKIREEKHREVQGRLHKPVDRHRFTMAPISANAYYSQTTVTIKILVGILTNPFYDHLYHLTSNLGAIGSVIGHEMNHGFDSRGQQYDQHGNFHTWWTNETTRRFHQHTKCFVDQYSQYRFHGLNNRGRLTVAENMADNGGLQAALLAYKIYKDHHSLVHGFLPGLPLRDKQLFFLSFAQLYCGHYTDAYAKHAMKVDPHSPYPHRVLGTLSNQKEFAEAFKCPAGSRYNPSKRCLLW